MEVNELHIVGVNQRKRYCERNEACYTKLGHCIEVGHLPQNNSVNR